MEANTFPAKGPPGRRLSFSSHDVDASCKVQTPDVARAWVFHKDQKACYLYHKTSRAALELPKTLSAGDKSEYTCFSFAKKLAQQQQTGGPHVLMVQETGVLCDNRSFRSTVLQQLDERDKLQSLPSLTNWFRDANGEWEGWVSL